MRYVRIVQPMSLVEFANGGEWNCNEYLVIRAKSDCKKALEGDLTQQNGHKMTYLR